MYDRKTVLESPDRSEARAAVSGEPDLAAFLQRPKTEDAGVGSGVVVGELLAIAGGGTAPLVTFPQQPGAAAVTARSVVTLLPVHVGCPVVLAFDGGDLTRPIVLGVVRTPDALGLEARPPHLEVSADHGQVILSAREELVLRCGSATITLHRDGRVLVQGTRLTTHASGVNRIRGGSVEIN